MITNVVVYCCVHFSYVQRISNYNKIKSYKENREWVKSYLLCLWYLNIHDAFKIKLQEINSSWLDFNKSLQLVQVTTQSYFDIWIHTVISPLNHYMCTNHRNTICHTTPIQSSGLWRHIIRWAVPNISKEHCTFIIKALQSFKISATTHLMTGCYNPQNLNIQ